MLIISLMAGWAFWTELIYCRCLPHRGVGALFPFRLCVIIWSSTNSPSKTCPSLKVNFPYESYSTVTSRMSCNYTRESNKWHFWSYPQNNPKGETLEACKEGSFNPDAGCTETKGLFLKWHWFWLRVYLHAIGANLLSAIHCSTAPQCCLRKSTEFEMGSYSTPKQCFSLWILLNLETCVIWLQEAIVYD